MYSLLIGPTVGALIGYITNDIAIRMLFKPHRAHYIGRWRIPFTPGIIPKEKDRIAGAIGNAISENLMNREVLEQTLMSNELLDKLRYAISSYVDTLRSCDLTIEEYANNLLTDEEMHQLRNNVIDEMTTVVNSNLSDTKLGITIAHMACEHVIEKTRNSIAGKIGADLIVEKLTVPLERHMAAHINEVLQDKAPSMVDSLVGDAANKFCQQKVSTFVNDHQEQFNRLTDNIVKLYCYVITTRLPRILNAINISSMVEKRIQEMDVDQVEDIILNLAHNELRAIVWLGALLGCIMGTITSFF